MMEDWEKPHKQKKLQIISPDPEKHTEEIFDLTGKAFSGAQEYYNWVEMCHRTYVYHGSYDWKASAIGLLDGRIVTHWGVWRFSMRIGSATVVCGGIGDVATDARYRRHGLMGATGNAAMQHMRREGHEMSLLFGRANYYDRFGYCRAYPGHHWTAPIAELPATRPPARVRLYRPTDIRRIDALYNRTHAGLTGTVVHPNVRHENLTSPYCCHVWPGPGGKLAGYLVASYAGAEACVIEHAGKTEQVLAVLAQQARKNNCQTTAFLCLHYDSDLCRTLRRGNCSDAMGYLRSGGQMIATVNLAATLQKLAPDFSARLAASPLAGWRGRLRISDPTQSAALKIAREKVTVVADGPSPHAIRGGHHVAGLLLGAQDPLETVEQGNLRLTGDAKKLLGVLFPDQHPMVGMRDHF